MIFVLVWLELITILKYVDLDVRVAVLYDGLLGVTLPHHHQPIPFHHLDFDKYDKSLLRDQWEFLILWGISVFGRGQRVISAFWGAPRRMLSFLWLTHQRPPTSAFPFTILKTKWEDSLFLELVWYSTSCHCKALIDLSKHSLFVVAISALASQ